MVDHQVRSWVATLCVCMGLTAALADEPSPLKYNHVGLTVEAGVGLNANPLPMDYDGDGDVDLVVATGGVPTMGIWVFENPGATARMPVFKAPVRVSSESITDLSVTYGTDGGLRVIRPNEEMVDFRRNLTKERKSLQVAKQNLPPKIKIRRNQWRLADYDGDGVQDLIIGIDEWGEYGWHDAFNSQGEWTDGPLHGYVYVLRNAGSEEKPNYQKAQQVQTGQGPVDTYGQPSPCFADFRRNGRLDLVCSDFIGRFTYFRNKGTRTQPVYEAGRPLRSEKGVIRVNGMMIQAIAFDWGNDGKVDIIFGEESGYVGLIENTGEVVDDEPIFKEPVYFQQEADVLKFGVLATPVAFDWDGDGRQDLVSGNAGGYVGFFRNLGGDPPKWAAVQLLTAGGKTIRVQAGANGSIQGPAEDGWGYTTLSVADWDLDGLPDIVLNSIWGKVVWYRNVGTRTEPKLAEARPIEVEWAGPTPKPEWTWWEPEGKSLVTLWRTTPCVIDLDADGLPDLVMMDRDGFLSLFRRTRVGGELELLPPRHVFLYTPNDDRRWDEPVPESMARRKRPPHASLRGPEGQLEFGYSRRIGTKDERSIKIVDRANDPAFEAEEPGAKLRSYRISAGWGGGSGRLKLAMVDWDGDGRLDVLTTGRNIRFLRNMGETNGRIHLDDKGDVAVIVLTGHDTSPTACDFDGNGVPDLVIGAEDGCFYYMKNPLRSAPVAKPVLPLSAE